MPGILGVKRFRIWFWSEASQTLAQITESPLGWSNRDTTADALRTRYLRVGLGNGLNAYLNVGRIGRDAPPILVLPQGAAMVVAASLRAFITGTDER